MKYSLHESRLLKLLYILNVICSVMTYFNLLSLVVYVPYQVYKVPARFGPSWLYTTVILILVFEYALWALEVSSFWFNTEA